ncbi:MAG: sigma-E factor negative regulatory protein [Agarilytica sp.]
MTENSRSSRTQSSADSAVSESLSALVDGEHNELDLQRVLRAMGNEHGASDAALDEPEAVRETWSRFQLMSAVIHNEAHTTEVDCSVDLSAAIRDAIAGDATPKVKRFHFQSFSQGIGKTAVAAAVTFGVVFGVQQYSSHPGNTAAPTFADSGAVIQSSTVTGSTVAGAGVPQGFELPPLSARTVSTNSLAPISAASRPGAAPFADSRSAGSTVAPVSAARVVVPRDQFQEQMNRLMHKHAEQASISGGLGVIPFARVSNVSDEEKD